MLVPVGDSVSIPVEVVLLTPAGPRSCFARLVRHDGDQIEVVLEPGDLTHARPGTRVMVDSGESSVVRMVGVVSNTEAGRTTLIVEKSVRRDLREYPRTYGGIQLRYHVVQGDERAAEAREWIDGVARDVDGWLRPDPYMNFSATGLRFEEGEATCASGDLVLLHMGVPTSSTPWRATAEVVRCELLPEDERTEEATHFVALQFLQIPPEASQALARFTLRVLSALA